jgi:hypothetical protein
VATGNNSALATGSIAGIADFSLTITANNLTRPQLNNPPYGSGTDTMIQAVSGDIVQIKITYTNN